MKLAKPLLLVGTVGLAFSAGVVSAAPIIRSAVTTGG